PTYLLVGNSVPLLLPVATARWCNAGWGGTGFCESNGLRTSCCADRPSEYFFWEDVTTTSAIFDGHSVVCGPEKDPRQWRWGIHCTPPAPPR
ncbi:hypothetical protein PTT_02991, partial [Pyrenophora teres f. teres 0-1]